MGSIGTVLTTQMHEQTIFISEDGERFDNKEDCLEWERLKPIIEATFDFEEQDYAHEIVYWRIILSQEDIENGCIYPFSEWLSGPSNSGSEKLTRARGLKELARKFWPLDTLGPSSN